MRVLNIIVKHLQRPFLRFSSGLFTIVDGWDVQLANLHYFQVVNKPIFLAYIFKPYIASSYVLHMPNALILRVVTPENQQIRSKHAAIRHVFARQVHRS